MNNRCYETILSSMQEKYKSLTGHSADDASDIGIRLKVLAAELDTLWKKFEEMSKQVFPETAQGIYLDYHALQRGLERKKGTSSKGVLRFSRQTPAGYDIIIPKGRICQPYGDGTASVETTQEAVLCAGQLYADCAAQAVQTGSGGNLAPNIVEVMVNPPQGISAVTNPQAFEGGTDEESDQELRVRLLENFRNVSNGANAAYYMDEALKFEGIYSVSVLPTRRGAGTLDIAVSSFGQNPSDGLTEQIQQHFNMVREIGVDVKVLKAQEIACDLEIEISPEKGFAFATLKEKVKAAAEGYIKSLKVGQPLFTGSLGRTILNTDGVSNYKIKAPSADKHILKDQIIRCRNVTMTEMAVV